jgi:hypothetical protein
MKNLHEIKDQLIAAPKETLNKVFGIELSDDVDLKVLFETEKTRYIVIPYKETELNEKEIIRMGNAPCSTTNPATHAHKC